MIIEFPFKDKYSKSFMMWLLRRIGILGFSAINDYRGRLNAMDAYLQRVLALSDNRISLKIVSYALKNLQYKLEKGKVQIYIPETNIYGATLNSLCKLIDRGNLEVQPIPIFTDLFLYVSTNIGDLYKQYSTYCAV